MKVIGLEGDESEEAEQHWCRAGAGAIGPLALCLDAEVTTDLGAGDLYGPASEEPGEEVVGAGALMALSRELKASGL